MKSLLCFFFLVVPSFGQILGAFTTFSDEDSATSWGSLSFRDTDTAFDALWTFPGSDDAEIYALFDEDFEVSLFADGLSSGSSFVGDYSNEGIDTVRCDAYVEDITTFDELEFYFLSGDTFYYSEIFELDQSGWASIETSFTRDEWYIFDDQKGFQVVEITPAILSDVLEIGVTFYPNGTAANGQIVAIDNFTLLPDLSVPELTVDSSGTAPKLKFTGVKGMQYTMQQSQSLRGPSWNTIGQPFGVSGLSETTVAQLQRRFFRLISQPFFVEIP